MSTDEPPRGSSDDPFAKRPDPGGTGGGAGGTGGGSPYDRPSDQPPPDQPPPSQPPPGNPYSGGPYGAPPPGQGGGGPWNQGGGEPYGQGGQGGPGGPYGGGQGPYGQGGPDPLAGMPPLAPAGKRVLARIIDIVIVLIPAFLLDWAAVGLHNDFTAGRSAVGGVFTAGIGFLYEFFTTKATGQTIGKRSMGLRAAMLSDGRVPTPQASALRALILWLPAFCCSCVWFVIIGITVLADRPYRQGVHDKAAKTVVVEAA